jgi:SRSO17 transposase
MGAQHLPGEELWLVGKRRSTGELNYLSYLPPQTTMKQLAGAIKARWISEQGHQKIKEELELDHFEGRSWTGLHRHCLMSMIAFAFLQNQRLKKAKGGKKTIAKPPPQPSLPAIRQEILIALAHPPPSQCPHAVNP